MPRSFRVAGSVTVAAPYPDAPEQDSTDAIQAVIDEAAGAYLIDNVPRTVRLEGHYRLRPRVTKSFNGGAINYVAALEMRDGVNIRADNDALTYLPYFTDDEDHDFLYESGYPTAHFVADNVSNWSVRGLRMASNGAPGDFETPTSMIGVGGACFDWDVCENYMSDHSGNGVLVSSDSGPAPHDFRIDRNTFRALGGQVVIIQPTDLVKHFSVNYNHCRDALTGAECIATIGLVEDYEVIGNLVRQWGPIVVAGDLSTIAHNHVRASGAYAGGIGYYGGDFNTISDNYVEGGSLENSSSAFNADTGAATALAMHGNTWVASGEEITFRLLIAVTDLSWHDDIVVSEQTAGVYSIRLEALTRPAITDIKHIGGGLKHVRMGVTDGGTIDGFEVQGGTLETSFAAAGFTRIGDRNSIVAP